jgi:hypothetical protein
LNLFEIKLIRFKNRSGALCCRPHLSAPRRPARSRSPRTPSLPAGPRRRPAPFVSHARPRRVCRCSAATTPPVRAAAGPLSPDVAPLHCPRHAWAPSLSLPLRPTRHPTPQTPPPSARVPPVPFKRALPPAVGRIFSLAPCFSSRFDVALAATFLASTAGHRTAPRMLPPRRSCPPTGTPPRRPLPAAPPSPDLLGEPRLRSSCPAPPRDPTGARWQHLAVGKHPLLHRRARHRAGARMSCAR